MMICGDGIVSYKGHLMNQETYEAIREAEEKKDYNHIYNQLCEAREIICKILSSYKDKKEIDYSTIKRGEEFLEKDIFK